MNNKTQGQGQIKFLNAFGDITIEWEEKDKEKMEKLIQEKLDEGFQFFIVKKRFFGLLGSSKKKIKTTKDIKSNQIYIKDKDIEKYFQEISSLKVIDDETDKHEVVENSRDVKKIVKSTTVCTKPPTRG